MFGFVAIFGGVAALFFTIGLLIILGSLLGAFFGWVVGLCFPSTMGLLAEILGVQAEPWQLGLIFGFVGGFFRSSLQSK